MAVTFTKEQQAAVDVRDRSVLVSAAAGSGKTAVLVERIIRMVSDRKRPVDIDRLLVVTFTNAAAAQMRERITQALSREVEKQPGAEHLVRQLTLIHNAQITTIDSFCLYLIRNHFDEIGLDPDFRVADEGEIRLLSQDVLRQMLEEYFDRGEQDFLDCVEYFAPASNEKRLEEQILALYDFVMSYPWPEEWLETHKGDYEVTPEELEQSDWACLLWDYVHAMLKEAQRILLEAEALCEEADGPYMYMDALEADQEQLAGLLAAKDLRGLEEGFSSLSFERFSSRRDERVSPEKRERAKALRGDMKTLLGDLAGKYFHAPLMEQAERMAACAPHARTLLSLTQDYCRRLDAQKREKNLLDFHDMEHMALSILTERTEEGVRPSRTALELREHFVEIMIDEYQDSNLVQEYLLWSISGEEEGKYNRFMVGDVKQSIYKFRLARPELFMDKFERYAAWREEEPFREKLRERRIDLRQNFRSRPQVTQSVNRIFFRIMGKDLGGVAYDENAALYPGASFQENQTCEAAENKTSGAGASEGETSGCPVPDPWRTEMLLTVSGDDGLEDKEREALAVAGRIREMVGRLPVLDGKTGKLRPAAYGDMVILLRTTAGWDEVFKRVLEECGIPAYISSRTGYFAATEVQNILNFLKILNNPLQDIPLFGVLKSPAAGFTDQEIACIRAGEEGRRFYHSLERYAREGERQELRKKAEDFLAWFSHFREYTSWLSVRRLIGQFLKETGYLHAVSALPGGEQRRANVEMLLTKAENFEKTSYFGLFHFIRYMEQVEKYDIDYGEASLQDENADTVRIMSIHKSKGLEFPVCFVSGLSKRFNMQDTAKPVILDMDYGIGMDYVDSALRLKQGTLKKSVLAGKLRRDSLGEELRVLYVAMTRAKEKLILTGNCREEKAEELRKRPEEESSGEEMMRASASDAFSEKIPELLPFSLRVSASCYLDWLLPAVSACGPEVTLLTASDLLAGKVRKEQGKEQLRQKLEQWEKEGTAAVASPPESTASVRLQRRMESVYPHENLAGLYTKTTVSELKKAGMEETAEEAFRLFEQEEPVPYLPRFIREEEKMGGAVRGSAYHKALELFDFAAWFSGKPGQKGPEAPSGETGFLPAENGSLPAETGAKPSGQPEAGGNVASDTAAVRRLLDGMAATGLLEKEYRQVVRPEKIARFLNSPLAYRMGNAARLGSLHKEQPFVLGLPAAGLDPAFPQEETVLIQGIIDVYFEEDDGLVVADYKTDAVKQEQELVNRYRVQLEYYAKALEQLTGRPVRQKIIYSFALQKEIRLE